MGFLLKKIHKKEMFLMIGSLRSWFFQGEIFQSDLTIISIRLFTVGKMN